MPEEYNFEVITYLFVSLLIDLSRVLSDKFVQLTRLVPNDLMTIFFSAYGVMSI